MKQQSVYETDSMLDQNEVLRFAELEEQLPLIAELTGNDVFLDCYDRTGRTAMVAAQARPQFGTTLYSQDVIGKTVLKEMEPAVYKTLESGMPCRDLKAVTQEGRKVRQDVVPVKTEEGRIIGVLIREKDISESLLREQKYRELSEQKAAELNGGTAFQKSPMRDLAIRESHHRIKNDLQMIASMINLQARSSKNEDVRSALHESSQRVLSIAAIQETLMRTGEDEKVHLMELLNYVCRNVQIISCEGKKIEMKIRGDDLLVTQDMGTSLAVIANELISNAAMHAFECGEKGIITVAVSRGSLYSTLTVEDSGIGFDVSTGRPGSLGFDIVRMTAEEKLHGKFAIVSGKGGTKASVSFRMT